MYINSHEHIKNTLYIYPGIPTTIKTMGVNITTIVCLRVLIIQIGSTIILMVVEAQGLYIYIYKYHINIRSLSICDMNLRHPQLRLS